MHCYSFNSTCCQSCSGPSFEALYLNHFIALWGEAALTVHIKLLFFNNFTFRCLYTNECVIGSNIFPILQTDLCTFNVSGKYSSYFRYQPIINTSPADGSLSLQSLILLSDTDWGVMTVISTRWHYVCNFTDRSPRHTQDAILQSFDLLFCLSGSNFDSVCPKKRCAPRLLFTSVVFWHNTRLPCWQKLWLEAKWDLCLTSMTMKSGFLLHQVHFACLSYFSTKLWPKFS